MVLFGLLATAIVFFTAGSGSAGGAPNTQGITVASLEAADGVFGGIRNVVSMLGIVTLVIWAIFVTSDYSSGLIRLLVQAEPSRLRLLGGKVVALTAFTCLATLATTVIVPIASPGIAGLAGVSTHAWSSGLVHTVVVGYVDLTLCVLLWGVVGLFVGMLTRSTGISIGIGIGYLVVFEGLAGLLLHSGKKWRPGSAFSAIASGGSTSMSLGVALLVAAGYALAAFAVSAIAFRRLDITA
jgi:ABC-type transport system involved in multi-copper enzyme maturation permease subunit